MVKRDALAVQGCAGAEAAASCRMASSTLNCSPNLQSQPERLASANRTGAQTEAGNGSGSSNLHQ